MSFRKSVRPIAVVLLLLALSSATEANANPLSWRISAYGGTATRLSTSDVFLRGHFHPDGSQIGVSLDHDFANLGSGFTLVGELGATRFVAKSCETSAEIGLGVRYDFDVLGNPVGVSGFTGPSWASGEPTYSHRHFPWGRDQLQESAMAQLCGYGDGSRTCEQLERRSSLLPSLGRVWGL